MDVEGTIKFILEHQAKFSAEMEKLQEGFAEMRENQMQAQRQQLFWQENFGRAMLGLTDNLDRLGDRVDRVAEAQQFADQRFAEFVRYTNDRFAKVEGQVDNLNRPN
jgi:FtsZ-binding cell division protein ZapB